VSELPRGWSYIEIEDVATDEPAALTDGPFGSNLKTSHYTASGPRVIRLQNIGDGLFIDEKAHISEQHFERLRKHEAIAGDVIIAMLGEALPRACVTPDHVGPAIVKADCVRLRVDDRLTIPRYVSHALNSDQIRSQAAGLVHGVGRPRLGLKWLRVLKVPLAPRAEQQRIVEAIDSYFTRLDDAVATLERVQRNLKRYRASVLKAAVEGRLVPTEAELARAEGYNYEPASLFLQRILDQRRRRSSSKYAAPIAPQISGLIELPEGWCWASIDQVAAVGTGATPKRGEPRFWSGGTIPWVTSAVVNEATVDHASELVTQAALGETNLTLYPAGTVLVAMYGEGKTRGRATVLGIEATTNQALAALELIDTSPGFRSWILAFFEHNYFELRRAASGGVQPNLNLGVIRQICVPIPPVAEQVRIVQELQRTQSLEAVLSSSAVVQQHRIARLRQSILKWAFEGRLVDQDPSDEPASALLERIKAERAVAPKTRGKRAKRKSAPA